MKKALPLNTLREVPLVYFVQSCMPLTEGLHPVKIGVTGDLLSRLAGLRGDNAHPLELLGVVTFSAAAKAQVFERRLHGKFRTLHLHNEWFKGTVGLLAFIKQTSSPVNVPPLPAVTFTAQVLLPAREAALHGPLDQLLTLRQVADLLHTTPRMVRDLTRNGFLPALRLTNTVLRYERTAVSAAVAEWDLHQLNKILRQQAHRKDAAKFLGTGGLVVTRYQIEALLQELRDEGEDAAQIAKLKP